MYLVAAEDSAGSCGDGAPHTQCHSRWATFPASDLAHHGEACCETARQWLGAMDFAQLNGGALHSGPRWIRSKYEWGPSKWPLHWCEALKADVIDCGAHAALAHEAFKARGLTSFRAQFVQSYGMRAVDQWRTRWTSGDASDHWLGDGYIYHEGNALVVAPGEIKLWDGSAAFWLNPKQTAGYGGVLAVRIWADEPDAGSSPLQWGGHCIPIGIWHTLDQAPANDSAVHSPASPAAGDDSARHLPPTSRPCEPAGAL